MKENATPQRRLSGLNALRTTLLTLTIVLGLGGLGVLGYRWAQIDALAILTQRTGGTDRDTKANMGKWFVASLGDEFSDGDGARTTRAAEAYFQLVSGAQLTLKPASQIRFGRRGNGREAVGLTVEVGEVDVRTKERTLTINSQFGEVVIEPNSLIRLRRNGAEMMVSVEVGGLRLQKDDEGPRRYSAGETLTLAIGGIVLVTPEAKSRRQLPGGPAQDEQTVEVGDGISHADLVLSAGESCVIHDPSPPTAVGISLRDLCPGPARVIMGKWKTEAVMQANLPLPPGTHKYTIRCLNNPEVNAATGQVQVLRDAGTRKLPSFTPQANVSADGRNYTVLYQSRLPEVTVSWPGAPEADKYFLVVDGESVTVNRPSYTLASGRLKPGVHKLAFRAVTSPPRQSRTTTVVVKYDAQAPTGRLSELSGKSTPGSPIPLSGQALPGWSVAIDGKSLELDARRQFNVEIPSRQAVAIAFTHPERETHYYLRRPRAE